MTAKKKTAKKVEGSVLVLRTVKPDMTSTNGFTWPKSGMVEAPDWKPVAECGHGLHGLLWGTGDSGLLNWNENAKWIVVRVSAADIVDLNGKVKFPRGEVVYCGNMGEAAGIIVKENPAAIGCIGAVISPTGPRGSASATGDLGSASATGDLGSASATGYRGSASATGDRGSASATGYLGSASATGDRGSASATGDLGSASATGDLGSASATGDLGSASATGYLGSASATGYRGSASATGDRGSASATGYRGSASATGDRGSASATGDRGSASATEKGLVILGRWDDKAKRQRVTVLYPGEDGIKANTWYRLDDNGKPVEIGEVKEGWDQRVKDSGLAISEGTL